MRSVWERGFSALVAGRGVGAEGCWESGGVAQATMAVRGRRGGEREEWRARGRQREELEEVKDGAGSDGMKAMAKAADWSTFADG